jgi:hypothetical protein
MNATPAVNTTAPDKQITLGTTPEHHFIPPQTFIIY